MMDKQGEFFEQISTGGFAHPTLPQVLPAFRETPPTNATDELSKVKHSGYFG